MLQLIWKLIKMPKRNRSFFLINKDGLFMASLLVPIVKEHYNYFEKKGIDVDFIEINNLGIDKNNLLEFLRTKVDNQQLQKHNTIPIIFYNGNFIGGFSQLKESIR